MWEAKLNELLKMNQVELLKVSFSGSKLYGTETENSDTDIKFIFLPNLDSLLLEEAPEQISWTSNTNGEIKNSKEDIDIQGWSVSKFVKLLNKGDSIAVSLLFSEDLAYVCQDYRLAEATKFFSKLKVPHKISGMIGFAKAQAYRYSAKGDKLNFLKEVINVLSASDPEERLYNVLEVLPKHKDMLEVLNEKQTKLLHVTLDNTAKVEWILSKVLIPLEKTYGGRAKEAGESGGIDYKSISHSLRIFREIETLHKTGQLTYPHNHVFSAFLRLVKRGELSMPELSIHLDFYENEALEAEKNSILDNDAVSKNIKEFKRFILGIYGV